MERRFLEWLCGEFGERKAVGRPLGNLAVTMKGVGPRGDLVGVAELIVGIVEFVYGFVVTICEDGGFALMRIVVRTRFVMVLGMLLWL